MKNLQIVIITGFILTSITLFSQVKYEQIEEINENVQSDNFNEFQTEINRYFEDNPDAKGYKQWKRKEWFLEQRFYPSGDLKNISGENYKAFQNFAKAFPAQMKPAKEDKNRSPHGSWFSLGPGNTNVGGGQGRLNSVDVQLSNDNVIWVTSPTGGIWKSTNGGTTWLNKTSSLPLISFADLEISPTNSNIVYALTGDGDPVPGPGSPHSQMEIFSTGVIRTSDGGDTWQTTNFSFDVNTGPIIPTQLQMHPSNPNIQFVASKDGIYKTTNGWVTNTKVFTGTTYDIEFKPGTPNTMYASSGNTIRRSTDGGDTWNTISDTDFSSMSGSSRIELAVSANQPNWVYAMAGNWGSGTLSILRSTSSGANNTWTIQDQTTNVIGSFATYCIALEVDPSNANRIYGAGVGTWRSNSSGSTGTWTNVGAGSVVHADVHDILYQNGSVYVASDGGLFKSTDNGANWTDLSIGLRITEIYRMTGTNSNSNLYLMGTQDNGTYRKDDFSSTFDRVLGADGMDNLISWDDSDLMFACIQNGGVFRSTDGGSNFFEVVIPGSGNWITPIIQDPANKDRIFVGKTDCYRSTTGGASGSFVSIGSPWGGNLNCLAQGTSFTGRLYASSSGSIYRSDNATAAAGSVSWTDVSAGLPGNFITDIAVDPANSMHVFVTMSGFSVGTKVYESPNGGANWTNISGILPNTPINCIEIESGNVNVPTYIGTDIGVFYRSNVSGGWIYFSDFLPSVIVNDLYINTSANTITAGTYGRGLWRSDLKSGCFNDVTFSSGVTHSGTIFYAYDNSITSSAQLSTNIGTEISYQAGNVISLLEGFRAQSGTMFEAKLGPCPN